MLGKYPKVDVYVSMNLNVGSVLNTVTTIAAAATGTNDTGKASLKAFLETMTKYGTQVKSNFEVVYNGIIGLQFFIQQISIPGLKTNNSQIHYKGRIVDIPINYEQEHEIQMTVINDGSGFIYQTMRKILIEDYQGRMIKNNYTMDVTAMGDQQNFAGMKIKMEGIRFTGVSGLDFSHTDNGIQTFTVNCQVASTQILQSKIEHEEGFLDKVNNFSNKLTSAASKITGR